MVGELDDNLSLFPPEDPGQVEELREDLRRVPPKTCLQLLEQQTGRKVRR